MIIPSLLFLSSPPPRGYLLVLKVSWPYMVTYLDWTPKVNGVLNGYFSQLAHFSKDMKHTISTRWLAYSN